MSHNTRNNKGRFVRIYSLTSDVEKNIVDMYLGGQTYSQIYQKTRISFKEIRSILDKNNIELRVKPFSSEEETDLIARYRAGENVVSLSTYYRCSKDKVIAALQRQNVELVDMERFWESKRKKAESEGFIHFSRTAFDKWKQEAQRRELERSLTPWDIERKFQSQNGLCYYSRIRMHFMKNFGETQCTPRTMSLDRIDSSLGYTQDNVVLCCVSMNFGKNAFGASEFKQLMSEIMAPVSADGFVEGLLMGAH